MNNDLGTYLYSGDIPNLFMGASKKLYDAVVHTIGPNGSNTAIPTGNSFLSIINDGKTILESISSADSAERLALNTLKESSYATNKEAGDGTSSTVILQHHLLEYINDWNNRNATGNTITAKHVETIRDLLLEKLGKYKKEIKTDDDLKNIITVALGSDKFTDIVFSAFGGLATSQKPTLVKVNAQKETKATRIDGVNLAPVEINPVVLKSISLAQDEPLNVVILNQEISRLDNGFATLLQKISKSTKKTILLYTDIKPSVMDQLLFNIQEGALNLIPVRLAMPITDIPAIITDLEKYFKCTAFSDLYPYQTHIQMPEWLGSGIGYIMNKDSIVIKNDNPEYSEEEHLIPDKSSAIEVGFITYSQQAEDYRRLEDAIQSAYNARQFGYVLGAGYTYFCLADELKDITASDPIICALSAIFNYLSPDTQNEMFAFIDTIEKEVFDSYKVAEQVILNAFTVVAQILSTKCLLVPYQRNRVTGQLE